MPTDDPIQVGSITPDDVVPLARLHRAAFPGFFLSTLGEQFLVQFYRGFLRDPSAVTAVARSSDGTVLGGVVGTTEPTGFFSRLLKRQLPGFAWASAQAVVANPRVVHRLLRAVRYRGESTAPNDGALLSSICVDPSRQSTGLGGRLMEAWTRQVAHTGMRAAFLTTDAADNDKVNQFYADRGWLLASQHTTPEGRVMNRYTITLDGDRC